MPVAHFLHTSNEHEAACSHACLAVNYQPRPHTHDWTPQFCCVGWSVPTPGCAPPPSIIPGQAHLETIASAVSLASWWMFTGGFVLAGSHTERSQRSHTVWLQPTTQLSLLRTAGKPILLYSIFFKALMFRCFSLMHQLPGTVNRRRNGIMMGRVAGSPQDLVAACCQSSPKLATREHGYDYLYCRPSTAYGWECESRPLLPLTPLMYDWAGLMARNRLFYSFYWIWE